MTRRDDIRSRILANVAVVDAGYLTPCWLWTMADSGRGRGGGYPRLKLNGRTCAAHKVSFANEHGYVPGNKQIDHKCRNRMCVNPDHLEMVSHIENQKRRARARHTSPDPHSSGGDDGRPDKSSDAAGAKSGVDPSTAGRAGHKARTSYGQSEQQPAGAPQAGTEPGSGASASVTSSLPELRP